MLGNNENNDTKETQIYIANDLKILEDNSTFYLKNVRQEICNVLCSVYDKCYSYRLLPNCSSYDGVVRNIMTIRQTREQRETIKPNGPVKYI